MSNQEIKCDTGCMSYSGGEKRHIKTCPFYEESFSKMYDDAISMLKEASGFLSFHDIYFIETRKYKKFLKQQGMS